MTPGLPHDLQERLEEAARLARLAGVAILQRYGDVAWQAKAGGSPVTAADLEANRIISDGLCSRYPDEPILSEESRDDARRLECTAVWIVDPLDGTQEYLAQNGEFAVMIGLAVTGQPVLGIVYAPASDVLYGGARGLGAWREQDGERQSIHCRPPQRGALTMVASRSHREPRLARMCDALGIREVQRLGSVGLKCARVAEGAVDVYVHPSVHLKEWDTCAPAVLALEAGCSVSDCLGKPLAYNQAEPAHRDGIVVAESTLQPWVVSRIMPLQQQSREESDSTKGKSA
jgi:3'(2'), 5'-bisphosphate nucleotidase